MVLGVGAWGAVGWSGGLGTLNRSWRGRQNSGEILCLLEDRDVGSGGLFGFAKCWAIGRSHSRYMLQSAMIELG